VISASDLLSELQTLLALSHRLMPPLNERPHIFHEQKSALSSAIMTLIEKLRGVHVTDRTFRADQVDSGASQITIGNRVIPVRRAGTRR
jgi:hypothetical protein